MSLPASLFARRTAKPRRGTPRPAATRRRSPWLDRVEALERRDLLAVLPAGVQRSTPDQFFTDFSVGMTSEYTGYTIANDASGPAADVWVKAVFPTGSPVGCSTGYNNEDGLYRVGTLAAGATGTAFLYFTANSLTPTTVPYALEVYTGEPGNGGSFLFSKPFAFTSVVNTIQASPNQIDTVSFTPLNPTVGDTLDLKVTGYLGNGADRVLFAPASRTDWQPEVFELRNTAISISGVPQTADRLFYDGLTGLVNQQPFTADYFFEIRGTTTAPTPLLPTQFTQDGAQDYKHHRVGEAPFPPIPPVLPALSLTKDDGVTTYLPGGTTTYTIQVANTGNAAATGVVISDILPPQLDAALTTWSVSYVNGSGSLPISGSGNIAGTVTLPALTGLVTITINGVILSSAEGAMTNTVTATLPGSPTLTASDTNTAAPLANLSITKTNATTTVLAGGGTTQTYTITVRNNGASDARNVVVADIWPVEFTQGVFGPISQGTVTPGAAGSFTWTVGTLVANGEATLKVNYTVAASVLPAVYTNTANVTSTTPDPVPDNNSAFDTTTVIAAADLAIEKTDGVTTVTAGGGTTQTYTITVRNNGASDARNVVVNDAWPAGFTQGGFGSPSQGTVTPGIGGSFAWSLGTLAANGVATLTVAYTVPASTLPGTYTNTAAVTSTTPDPVSGNETATDTTDVVTSANLTITKDDGVTTILAGGGTTQTYTLTVRNLGVSDAQSVVVNDTWPVGVTRGTFGIPSQGSIVPGAGSNFSWSIGTLPTGGVATVTVTYTVPASTLPGSYTNTATVSSLTPDPDGNNTATDTNTVTTSADLAITKSDGLVTVTAGDGVTHAYLITVRNLGASDAQSVSVVDTWPVGFDPAGFDLPSQGSVVPGVGGNFTWSVGLLPAGGVATLAARYTVPASTPPGAQVDTAIVSSATPDPVPGNNTATDSTDVIARPDLSITKSDGVATVVAGGGTTQTYTITIRNDGVSDARGVVASDLWPAGFTQGSFGLPSQGSVTSGSGGDFTWTVGTLPAGGTATLTVAYTVAASVLPGPRTNTATVTSIDDPETHTATDVTNVLTSADVIVAKTDFTTTATAGDGITRTYLIRVRNGGVSDAQGVVLTDLWPAGFEQAVIGTPTQGTVTPTGSGNFTWSIGTLAAGVQVVLQVSYVVPSSTLPGSYVNAASVTSDTPDPFGPNTISDTTAVVTSANVTIEKDDGVTTVLAGDGMPHTYTITVRNPGPSDALGVVVSDLWPAGFTQTGLGLPSQGSVVAGVGGNFSWTVGTVAAAGSATLAVTYVVPSSTLPGSYTNTATVASATPDPDGNNTATDMNTVTALANLVITKDDGVTSVVAGGGTIQTYKIRVSNTGASNARDVVVSDLWPAGFVPNGAPIPSQGSVTSGVGDNFTWNAGTIAAGADATLTITYVVPAATLPGDYTNKATVTTSTPDANPVDMATDTTSVTAVADLSITKTDGVVSVVAGDGVIHTYTLRVKNNGQGFSDAQDVVVTDTWPAAFVQGAFGTPSQGTVTPGSGGNFTWSVGKLAQGAEATLTVSYTVPADTLPGNYANTAGVASQTPDPVPGNDTATDTNLVVAVADLSVTKRNGDAPYIPGTSLTYTITAFNAGPSTVFGTTVSDPLPTETSFVSASGGATYDAATRTVTFPVGTLAPGGSQVFTLTVFIDPGRRGILQNTVTIAVPADVTDPNLANNVFTDPAGENVVADLTVTKTDGQATYVPGLPVTYTIVAGNTGPSTVFSTTVSDPLPAGTTFLSASGGGTYDPVSGVVTFPVGRLDPGATQTFTVTLQTLPDRKGVLRNTATIVVPVDVTDPNPANNTATDVSTARRTADLSVTKRNGDAPYVPGTSLTYTITAFNAGPSTVFGTTVSDPLPTETSFVSASGGATYDAATRTVTFPVGTLAPGGSQVFTLTVFIDPSRRGILQNTVTIAVPTGVTDPNLANNVFTDPAGDLPRVALGVTKTDGKTTYIPGTSTTYTIVVTNTGPSSLLGGTVSDPLPALASGGTWSSVATAGSSATPAGGSGSIVASINLLPGGTITFSYTITIKPTATGPLVNTVTVTPPSGTAGGSVSATDINALGDVPALVLGTDDGCNLAPWVRIINPTTGATMREFLAYDASFRGSVRVATGDLTGDGIAEIVVAPGRNLVGEIRVFTQQGVELTSYRTLAFGPAYKGGVEVAVGDVDGDGKNDIIAGQSSGAGLVNVFKVTNAVGDPVTDTPIRSFRPFASPYALGVTVAAGDFGTFSGGVRTSSAPDNRAEIVVGTNAGTRAQVRVYDASTITPTLVRTILPFASTFKGGVTLSTGRYDADSISDIVVGAGVNGNSIVEIYSGSTGAQLARLNAFSSFARPNAAVFSALLDLDGNGVADDIYGVQGRNATGGSSGVRRWNRGTNVTSTLPQSTGNAPPLRIAPIILRSAS